MLAIAALKPTVAVTAYLPMAENMPSGTAYRPGDVVTMYGGKRVEVLNTDAEGRMILADAIARACEDEPRLPVRDVDADRRPGDRAGQADRRRHGHAGAVRAGPRGRRPVGEPAWPMPLPDDVRKGMDSDVADISQVNAGMDRAGHMLQGGVFLREFVAEGVPWAHIDIAGPALPLRRADRLLDQGRHRRPGPHRCSSWSTTSPPTAELRPHASRAQASASLAALVVVAHPLRVADQLRRRRPGCRAGGANRRAASGLGDPAPGPLAVVRDEQHRRLGHGRPRLEERLDAAPGLDELLKMVEVGTARGRSPRPGGRSRRRNQATDPPPPAHVDMPARLRDSVRHAYVRARSRSVPDRCRLGTSRRARAPRSDKMTAVTVPIA